ncbi:yrdC domain-containing protein, mitochondrial [Coccinella septempunctata]|uniref:yrdC domain-containing protein, mitochondrial n=1 Tax=Coccinella septempunctata TaxID=41139 RepID=UPI001D099B50|nr:yrdC domain-containing protein, mitochondrial [Coccinella septempunctata]
MLNSFTGKFPNVLNNFSKIMSVQKGVEAMLSEGYAVKLLKSGGIIALPTDTIYGIACDATNIGAINKLYSVKCRDENKPLAICLGDIEDVKKWAIVDHLPCGLLQALLPGPVTLILQTVNKYLDKSLVCCGKVGIRIPNYDFIKSVANGLGKPLALTSANLSSQPSSVRIEEFEVLWDKLDGIFDGGHLCTPTISRKGSTIVDLSKKGFYTVVRSGMALENTCSILDSFQLTNT